jgi:hypothetical protein
MLADVSARADVAKSVGSALGEALSNADMKIVSDASIVERILSAAGHGQALDGFVGGSDNARRMLSPYLDGTGNIVADVAAGLGGLGAAGLRDLTITEFIRQLGGKLDGKAGGSDLIEKLQAAVAGSGLGGASISDVIETSAKA